MRHGRRYGAGVEAHEQRQSAESYGSDAVRYDRTRPPYPDGLVTAVVDGSPGRDVLDVGCGTGIAARQFQAAGCTVLGVEPDARMAEFARRRGLAVEVATFEDWAPAGREFDAVVAGTAWHWVHPVAGAAKAAAVLRSGGRLAVFWHVFQLPPAVLDAMVASFRKVAPDSPFDLEPLRHAFDSYGPLLTTAADGIAAAGGFGEPERWRFDWTRRYTRDEWLDQMPTSGGLAGLPPDKQAAATAGVGEAIDAMGGAFTMAYATVAVTAVRRGQGLRQTRR